MSNVSRHRWVIVVHRPGKRFHPVTVKHYYGKDLEREKEFRYPTNLAPREIAERALKVFLKEA